MRYTNEKINAKNNKFLNFLASEKKVNFIGWLIILILCAALVVTISYKIINKNNGVTVSGIILESNDYIDSLVENVANEISQDNNVDVSESQQEPEEPVKIDNSLCPSSNGTPYYIKVNYTANTVTIYKLDSDGKYSIPVKAMICSTGKATPTSGTYKTSDKYRWAYLNGNVWGQYAFRITGSILFHTVPYAKNSANTLKTSYYDQLGLSVSAGCVRLTVEDAKWIYDNCAKGTMVEFYSSSDPGPLGKPSAMKISDYPSTLNCWDPTDPDSSNPWKEYLKNGTIPEIKQQTKTEPKVQNENNNTSVAQDNPSAGQETSSSGQETSSEGENNSSTDKNNSSSEGENNPPAGQDNSSTDENNSSSEQDVPPAEPNNITED